MASSENIQASLNWVQGLMNYQPLNIAGLEPALTAANLTLQTVLGPPFCWRFNRKELAAFAIASPNQDYVRTVSDFGFIEKAWLENGDHSDMLEIGVESTLAVSASATANKKRPSFVSAQLDDNANGITFRFDTVPDASYNASIQYQKKARQLTSMANSWAPVPDEYLYIIKWGFLATCSLLVNDPRWPIFNQKFMSHLLGAQDGLDAMRRNIFLGNWEQVTKQIQRATQGAQQGTAARQQ